jgi:hypothetical protein
MKNKQKAVGELALPLNLKDSPAWPRHGRCPMCDKELDGAFAVINGGALMGEGDGTASLDGRLIGHLNLTWHGAHHHVKPSDNDVYVGVDVVEEAACGQFDLNFCSTACMRAFLNKSVDELEKQVEKRRAKQKAELERAKRKEIRAHEIELDGKFPRELDDLLRPHRVVAVGEIHGSNEIPGFFCELAKHMAKDRKPLVVALEIPSVNQEALNQFSLTRDPSHLENMPHFANSLQDGRSSKAMMKLIKKLKNLGAVHIVAFDAGADESLPLYQWQQSRDLRMGELLAKTLEENPYARMLVLAGNVHTKNSIGSFFDKTYRSAVFHMSSVKNSPVKPTDVFNMSAMFQEGETWTMTEDGKPPHKWAKRTNAYTEAVDADRYLVVHNWMEQEGHNAVLFIRKLTASPPYKAKQGN